MDLEEQPRITDEDAVKYAKDDAFYDNTYAKLRLLVENKNLTEEFYRILI